MIFQIKTINGQKTIVPLTADTGTGAPVGSLIVVCSNILPSGYLGLGVQYDITNYPALYQVLGTDTTPTASALGLPTLSSGQYAIKATSGLTENQQENVLNTINENLSYSTTEHKTGKKWIDGKDIYEQTFEVGIGVTAGTWVDIVSKVSVPDIAKLITHSETWGNNEQIMYASTVGITPSTSSIIRYPGVDTASVTLKTIHLEYTKTT